MKKLDQEKIKELKNIAKNIRKDILISLNNARSGHTAGPLGMTDIFTYLYFHALNHNPQNPTWDERDFLILSNGHICPVLYTALAHAGYYSVDEVKNNLRKFGSRFQGHPHREFLDILETSSGPLGEGLSQAIGLALSLKIDKKEEKVYCILGDGELNEGQNWEAFMLANKYKLNNLIVIIDRNNIQLDGKTEKIMPLEDLSLKLKSFNLYTQIIDGHSFEEIDDVISNAHKNKESTSIIIANTIPSKGIKEWENNYKWHGKVPNNEELELALKELENTN